MSKEVQDFWDNRPCNIKHSDKPVGSREYFDEVEARKYFVEPHIPPFAQFERWRGKQVLELGCGIGTDSLNFARAGAKITLVDVSNRSLFLTWLRFKIFGLVDQLGGLYSGDMEQLSLFLPKQKFDLIYAFGSVHHTGHPERVLQEIKQYCHAGTEIRLMLYARRSWRVLEILLKEGRGKFWRLKELVQQHSEAQTGCPVTFSYTEKEVRDLLRDFEITSIQKDHIFPFVVSEYVKYQYKRKFLFRVMPQRMFKWMERHFGWHYLIVAKARQK